MSERAAGLKFLCKECLVAPQKKCAKCDTINKDKRDKEEVSQVKQKASADEEDEYYDEDPVEGMSRRPKPRACRYFASGKCRFGKDCRDRHVGEVEQEKNQSSKGKGGGKPTSYHDARGSGVWQVNDDEPHKHRISRGEKDMWKIKQRATNE